MDPLFDPSKSRFYFSMTVIFYILFLFNNCYVCDVNVIVSLLKLPETKLLSSLQKKCESTKY